MKSLLVKVNTENNGHILVQFLNTDIDSLIKDGVDYLLENHANCRDTKFGGGTMVAAGHHYEPRSATVTPYVREKDPNLIDFNKDDRSTQDTKRRKKLQVEDRTKKSFQAFHDLILNSSKTFSNDLVMTMKQLKKSGNIMKIGSKVQVQVLPTYAVSISLNNPEHIDYNDGSRCYAVFYPDTEHALAYFLFAKYGVAIKMGKTPVLISWHGAVQPHCTATVNEGIKSLFGGSYKDVTKVQLVLHLLENPIQERHADTVIGDIVYHGEVVNKLKKFDDVYKLDKYKSTARAVRQAKVIEIHAYTLTIRYIGKWFKHGPIVVAKCTTVPALELEAKLKQL